MDIILNDDNVSNLIFNVKNDVRSIDLNIKVKSNISYNFLDDILNIFPTNIVNMIHKYTQDEYIIIYDTQCCYRSSCSSDAKPQIYQKHISIMFNNIMKK